MPCVFQCVQLFGDTAVNHVLQIFRINRGFRSGTLALQGFPGAVEVPSHFAVTVYFPLNGSHGVSAFFAEYLTRKPACLVGNALVDLLVLFEFPLTFQPDIGAYKSLMS